MASFQFPAAILDYKMAASLGAVSNLNDNPTLVISMKAE